MVEFIPSSWDKFWEGPEVPSEYLKALMNSTVCIEKWWGQCGAKTLLTSGPIDLSVLFHPGTFLNAYR